MARRKLKTWLIALACGGFPLITNVTCDPYGGFLDFYRDDDAGYYDDGYYYDDWYYYDDGYYYEDDCFFCF